MHDEDQVTRADREREGDGQDLPRPATGSIGRRGFFGIVAAAIIGRRFVPPLPTFGLDLANGPSLTYVSLWHRNVDLLKAERAITWSTG